MHDDLYDNVIQQNNIHREAGYLEGLADAYREMARKRSSDLVALERRLDLYVKQFQPPF